MSIEELTAAVNEMRKSLNSVVKDVDILKNRDARSRSRSSEGSDEETNPRRGDSRDSRRSRRDSYSRERRSRRDSYSRERRSRRDRHSRERRSRGDRSRSTSGRRTRSRSDSGHYRRHRPTRSWADRMDDDPDERPSYNESLPFLDSDDEEDDGKLRDVSEKTHAFLTKKCTRCVPNETRLRTRGRFPLPRVPATRTPQLDPFIKTEMSAAAKQSDRELARIQTFILDAITPLAAIIDGANSGKPLSEGDTLLAASTAAELLGNANARMSRLRREKAVGSLNKTLLPLAQDDDVFAEATPKLFGAEFAKRSKEHIDQVKALRTSIQSSSSKQQFFRSGPPNKGGQFFKRGGRGGASNTQRQRHQDQRRSNYRQYAQSANKT